MDAYNKSFEACISSIREAETALRDFKPVPMTVEEQQFFIVKLKRRHFRRVFGIVLQAGEQLGGLDFDFSDGIDFTAILNVIAQIPGIEDLLIESAVRKQVDGQYVAVTDAELDELDFDGSIGLAVMVLVVNIVHNHALRTFGGVARFAGRLAIAEAKPETSPASNSGEQQQEPGEPS